MAEILDFVIPVLKYLTGIVIVALAGGVIKLFKSFIIIQQDYIALQKEVAALEKHRKDDIIERNTVVAMAQTVKNETGSMEQRFDGKIKDIVHELSMQRHNDMAMIKEVISEIKQTLTELNTTIKFIKPNKDV